MERHRDVGHDNVLNKQSFRSPPLGTTSENRGRLYNALAHKVPSEGSVDPMARLSFMRLPVARVTGISLPRVCYPLCLKFQRHRQRYASIFR
jgi:hypothetical protein